MAMSYDIDMCNGIGMYETMMCLLCAKCKRFVLGQKALDENYYPIW